MELRRARKYLRNVRGGRPMSDGLSAAILDVSLRREQQIQIHAQTILINKIFRLNIIYLLTTVLIDDMDKRKKLRLLLLQKKKLALLAAEAETNENQATTIRC